MSQLLIQQYLNQLASLKKVSGTNRESVVREAFKDLLKGWARQHDLVFVPEYEIASPTKERRYVDGALLHALRMPFGYWEAKDAKDDLDAEIEFKFKRGYPQDNIIFEDSREAVLIQNRQEVMRCPVDDTDNLAKLLKLFFSHERAEIAEFRKAVEIFKRDLPEVLKALREMIAEQHAGNAAFRKASTKFLAHAQEAINPSLTAEDVREMLIQHVLTEEIFSKVFDESDFHRQNNVARELYALEGTFFTGDVKKRTLRGLDPYYAAIRAAAAQIGSHHEKQTFLKVIYENFYKVYNVKAADRLGVVYTPNEIVRFMIESADWLCEKHFGRNLIDKDVEILDPATGTGTFICELLEHFRGQPAKLKHKYAHELHANEVAILPYYVANLNIEATYAAITGEYKEFESLCFVDTLDNVGLHTAAHGTTADLFGSVSEENVARIRRQNSKKISVIIGNPPYNANQSNENDNNKNREYPAIDQRIKNTYIAESTAQKTKLYDMYARFYRWASDRVDKNGVISFVTNRGFIDKLGFDGFRKTLADEFDEVWIIDLGGDWKESSIAAGGGNVFGIGTGVAIAILVKVEHRKNKPPCQIRYVAAGAFARTGNEKLEWLSANTLQGMQFEVLRPNDDHQWVNIAKNDFQELVPLASKAVKAERSMADAKAIFKFFSLGLVTARDDWVYGNTVEDVTSKVEFLINAYELARKKHGGKKLSKQLVDEIGTQIKWTRAVKADLERSTPFRFDSKNLVEANYRPFVRQHVYFDVKLNEMRYQLPAVFGEDGSHRAPAIVLTDAGSQKPFMALAVNSLFDYHFVGSAAAGVAVPRFRLDAAGGNAENITDWSLNQFKKHYGAKGITKEAIFHYVYAVLHDPLYREKYALNLKREFPRIPFYEGFAQWAAWGKTLMDLHIGYESVAPAPLARTDLPEEKARKAGLAPKALLKADPAAGRIVLDSETTLAGIPTAAWTYRLGNRSALEWVLDQYKEKKPKDPTIREKFDTYRFADYKENVIDLLARVTTVSVETMRIVEAMKVAKR